MYKPTIKYVHERHTIDTDYHTVITVTAYSLIMHNNFHHLHYCLLWQ